MCDAPQEHDPAALFASVYDELRRLSAARLRQERAGHTLQCTALVHEVYLKLADSDARFNDRHHFLAAAAQAMRRILIDHARGRNAAKRGGGAAKVELLDLDAAIDHDPGELLDLDAALTDLATQDAELARLVELRFFAGLSVPEAGDALGMSPATVKRRWAYARAWLQRHLDDPASPDLAPG